MKDYFEDLSNMQSPHMWMHICLMLKNGKYEVTRDNKRWR